MLTRLKLHSNFSDVYCRRKFSAICEKAMKRKSGRMVASERLASRARVSFRKLRMLFAMDCNNDGDWALISGFGLPTSVCGDGIVLVNLLRPLFRSSFGRVSGKKKMRRVPMQSRATASITGSQGERCMRTAARGQATRVATYVAATMRKKNEVLVGSISFSYWRRFPCN